MQHKLHLPHKMIRSQIAHICSQNFHHNQFEAFRFHWLDSAKTKTQLSTPTANMWAWTARRRRLCWFAYMHTAAVCRLPTADCCLLAGVCWLLVGVWLADWLSTAVVHYNNHRVLGGRHDHSIAVPLLLLLLANVNLRAPQWIHSQKQTHSTGKPQRTHDVAQNSSQHVWASTSSLYWCALTLTWQTRWLCRLTHKFMSELAGSNDATTYCICMYVCIYMCVFITKFVLILALLAN